MHVENVYVCECTCIPQLHVIVFRVKYTPQTCPIILSKKPSWLYERHIHKISRNHGFH